MDDLEFAETYLAIVSAAFSAFPTVADSVGIPERVCDVTKALCAAQTSMLMCVVHDYGKQQCHTSKQKTKKTTDY